ATLKKCDLRNSTLCFDDCPLSTLTPNTNIETLMITIPDLNDLYFIFCMFPNLKQLYIIFSSLISEVNHHDNIDVVTSFFPTSLIEFKIEFYSSKFNIFKQIIKYISECKVLKKLSFLYLEALEIDGNAFNELFSPLVTKDQIDLKFCIYLSNSVIDLCTMKESFQSWMPNSAVNNRRPYKTYFIFTLPWTEKDFLFHFCIDQIEYNRLTNPKCLNDVEYFTLRCSSPIIYSKLSTILTTYYANVRSLRIEDLELIDNDNNNSSAIITRTITLNYVKFVSLSCPSTLTWKCFPKILRLIPNISNLSIHALDLLDFPAVLYNTPAFCNKIKCLELELKFLKMSLSQIVIYFDKLQHLRLYFFKYYYGNDDDTRLEYDDNDLNRFCFILMESQTLLSAVIRIDDVEMILTLYNKLINFRSHSKLSSTVIEIVHDVRLIVRK
ncbi:unnamed protein product, partial [Didymodactylos carnosus]